MIINNIKIGDIIINEINQLKDKGYFFTTYELFKILDNYLYRNEIFQLLNISQATYYKYKKERKNKYVDRKLYNLYLIITNESFKEAFENCDNIHME